MVDDYHVQAEVSSSAATFFLRPLYQCTSSDPNLLTDKLQLFHILRNYAIHQSHAAKLDFTLNESILPLISLIDCQQLFPFFSCFNLSLMELKNGRFGQLSAAIIAGNQQHSEDDIYW